MKNLNNFINEKVNIKNSSKKSQYDEVVFKSRDSKFEIEYNEDTELIRIIYNDPKEKKMIKYWFNQDTLQTSFEKSSCDIINEYNNIFNQK